MVTDRATSLFREIGHVTKEGKGASVNAVGGLHEISAYKVMKSVEVVETGAEGLARTLHSKYFPASASHPTNILQISAKIKYANRTLISAYCELGGALGLYRLGSMGRATLLTTTPVFDMWESLTERRFSLLANFVHFLAKQFPESPREVRRSVSDLKQAFFFAQTLEKDIFAKRRYEILTYLAIEVLAAPERVTVPALREMGDKLRLMQEMASIPEEEILEDFAVKQKGGRVSLEWTESG